MAIVSIMANGDIKVDGVLKAKPVNPTAKGWEKLEYMEGTMFVWTWQGMPGNTSRGLENAIKQMREALESYEAGTASEYDWNSNEIFWQSSKIEGVWFGAKDVGEDGDVVPDWDTLHEFMPVGG